MSVIDFNKIVISQAKEKEDINDCMILLIMNSWYKQYELRIALVLELMGVQATGGTILMAKYDGEIVGVAALSPKSFGGRFFEVVRIKRIAVIKSFTKQGVGRRLVQEAASIFGRIDAATETKSACDFFDKVLPFSIRQKGRLRPAEKAALAGQRIQTKNMRCYSNQKIEMKGLHAESSHNGDAAIFAKRFIDELDAFLLEQG